MSDLKKILKARGKKYGSYTDATYVRVIVMRALRWHYRRHNGHNMPEDAYLCMFDIVGKLIRLAATPNHIDSWHDIAGYATIIKKYYLSKEKKNAN